MCGLNEAKCPVRREEVSYQFLVLKPSTSEIYLKF